MVQVIPQKMEIGAQVGQAVGTGFQKGFSSGAEQGLKTLQEQLQQHRESNAIKKIYTDAGPNAPIQKLIEAFSSAPIGNPTKTMALNALGNAHKAQIAAEQQQKQVKQNAWTPEKKDKMSSLFEKFGMPKEEAGKNADLYGELTQGGQTAFANVLIDKIMRGQQGTGIEAKETVVEKTPNSQKADVEVTEGFEFPEFDLFPGHTPREKVQAQRDLSKDNAKEFNETRNKLSSLNGEGRAISQLERINKNGKLPKGLGRFNVNWETGELRIPALANAQTQLFVKTINDFTVKAKDSFGARVTNFELDRFMKRLPTLANTEDGRNLIINQMKTINNLNKLEKDSLKETYNHYGLRNIDSQKADEISEKLRKPKEDELIDSYNEGLSKIEGIEEGRNPSVKRVAEEKVMTKVEKGTSLDANMATKILQQAGGDKEKARKIAKGLGYGF